MRVEEALPTRLALELGGLRKGFLGLLDVFLLEQVGELVDVRWVNCVWLCGVRGYHWLCPSRPT